MRGALVVAAALLSGCAEKAVELRLSMPTGDDASMDVSCVSKVEVALHTDAIFAFPTTQCIDVSNATSLADLQRQVRGKLDMELPHDLSAIEVRGLTGDTASCGNGMNVFYAGEEYTGQDTIDLRVEGAIDCAALQSSGQITVRPVDFLALASTPAGMPLTCETVAVSGLDLGVLRPTNIFRPDLAFPSTRFEPGAAMATSATGTVSLPAWGAALATSCVSTGAEVPGAVSCVYPGERTLCGTAGETEMAWIAAEPSYESIDDNIWLEFPVLTFGIVVDTVTKKAVDGATVEIDPARGRVLYARKGIGTRLDPTGGAATDASGLFLVYMKEPSVVTVTQGASTKKMRVGGMTDLGSAVIVPLR